MSERAEEFRWEYYEVGQGHFVKNFEKARREAIDASLAKPDLTVFFELFKPLPLPLCIYRNGRVVSWRFLKRR
jgi:hypothetical protein